MGSDLKQIAEQLKNSQKKVQLIYAFNGTGKTRLSKEFKELIAPKSEVEENEEPIKILYYNAFTEDLFYWDNNIEPKLNIQPNTFTDWILSNQGDVKIISNFQRYTNDKLTPKFTEKDVIYNGQKTGKKTYPNITFSFTRGDETGLENIKISKGEESNFIWSIFYTLIEEVISELNKPELEYDDTNPFHDLEYVFIDDPVSSLDENHLIELAVDLAYLIKLNKSKINFIITTHNPLFYNVLFNELNSKDKDMGYKPKLEKYRLEIKEDATYELIEQPNDAPSSYHLFLKSELENVAKSGQINKYHFNYIRNILEKTSSFFGYSSWGDLLPKSFDEKGNNLYARVINLYSHSKLSSEEVIEVTDSHKLLFARLVKHLDTLYNPNLRDIVNDEERIND